MTNTTKNCELDPQNCSHCGRPHIRGVHIIPKPCKTCEQQIYRRHCWYIASPTELLKLCDGIGVPRAFCRNGTPPTYLDEGLRERLAVRSCNGRSALLIGPVGTHKTHLACARAVHAARKGLDVFVLKWSSFGAEVQNSYSKNAEVSEHILLENYRTRDHLIIDDLGVRDCTHETDWIRLLLHNLLDYRYDHNLSTDITTNLMPKDIKKKYGERIWRRIDEMTETYLMLEANSENPLQPENENI